LLNEVLQTQELFSEIDLRNNDVGKHLNGSRENESSFEEFKEIVIEAVKKQRTVIKKEPTEG